MKKRMSIMLILAIIVFGGIVGFYFFKQAMMKKIFSNFAPPAATVTTGKVASITWKPYLVAIGSLKAEQSIDVSPEIGGSVEKIYFHSGEYVRKGTPLVDLDSSTQIAQLKADQAALHLTQINYQRDLALYKRRAVSEADLDSSISNLQASQAKVEGDLSILRKMHIVAPFSGKLGIRQVSLGQFVAPPPASGNIVPLASITPLLLNFELPQQDLPQIHNGQVVELSIDAFPGKVFMGHVNATNSGITQTSRTMQIQAQVSNVDRKLVPGMFATAHVMLPEKKNVLVVPQTAIVASLYGNSVYVVGKDNKVTQVFVTLGQTQGQDIAVTKGLTEGATIVTSGQLKLHSGAMIKINNKVQPI
jgi:membrane fusion protein (multidrug efflux system)